MVTPTQLVAAGLLVVALLVASCGRDDVALSAERSPDVDAASTTTTTGTPTTASTTSTQPATTSPPTTATAPTTTTTEPPRPVRASAIRRIVVETGYAPYATAGDVVLAHPAEIVERVGFHEANHDGARLQDPTDTTARALTLETRERGTGARTAADVVVAPDTEIRAPVTGTVIRSGSYTLYCDNTDEYVVIEPDARPGWEVKILHFEGLRVATGQRVEAGVTPIAGRSRVLPFESQVDEHTAEPSWPHVHIEVVDPSIPDRPNPGGSGGC